MFRNYLAAALRNLARNRLYAAINILGLAVGFSAALFLALFIHHERSFDTWIPDHENVYRLSTIFTIDGSGVANDTTLPDVAHWLKLEYPSIGSVARLFQVGHGVRQGDRASMEAVLWADPGIFSVFPLTVVAGDLTQALASSGSVVLSRRLARKYFGRDDVVGEEILIDRQPMLVTAVIEDLPSNTHLAGDLFASALTAFSPLAQLDQVPWQKVNKPWSAHTYFRLQHGTSAADIAGDLPDFLVRHMPDRGPQGRNDVRFEITPVAAIHLSPGRGSLRPSGDPAVLIGASLIGAVILLIAGINFVNLTTARAGRRLLEVGVRKTAGARLRDLLAQFIGESLLYVGAGILMASSLVVELLPRISPVIAQSITANIWHEPGLLAGMALAFLVIGTAIGAYPALLLSRVRPAVALKGVPSGSGSGSGAAGAVRQGLVILQFGVLIILLLASGVIYRQTLYASNEALRLDKGQILLVDGCKPAFKAAVAALADVRSAACSFEPLTLAPDTREVAMPDRLPTTLHYNAVDVGFFETYGLKPVAGRFFSRDFGSDLPPAGARTEQWQEAVVINETAAASLGFASPAAAIGQSFTWNHIEAIDQAARTARYGPFHSATIVGVAPDFPMGSVRTRIPPGVFFVEPALFGLMHIKLAGQRIPETLAAIDGLWKQTGGERPISRYFFDQSVEYLYRDVRQQAGILVVFAAMALFIAALGLFGLSAFIAERRTKEIGIRKAMGAGAGEILRLLLWQFARPVLWANLIAWPAAFFIMRRWLSGFAYHIDLAPWMFLAAGGGALAIALVTVAGHSLLVARTRPVLALRYE